MPSTMVEQHRLNTLDRRRSGAGSQTSGVVTASPNAKPSRVPPVGALAGSRNETVDAGSGSSSAVTGMSLGEGASDPADSSLLLPGGNSTPSGGLGLPHTTTRTVHIARNVARNAADVNPQYGSFYTEYDPMTGARTAAILGSFLLLLVVYIIYKAKCHQSWTEEDDFYLQQYKQRQAKKALNQQSAQQNGGAPSNRRGTHYVIDPVCSPDPTVLANTAKWIQMQPLEDAVPAPAHGEKRKKRLVLSKYLSFSAEHINRQLLNQTPLVPNGHGPPPCPPGRDYDDGSDSERPSERSCNEYVPNGMLKHMYKDSIQGSDWSHGYEYGSSCDSPSKRPPVEFYIDDEDPRYDTKLHRRRSSHDDSIYFMNKRDRNEVDDLFNEEQKKPRKKSHKQQLEQFSSLDRHNNNDELEDRALQQQLDMGLCDDALNDTPGVDVCTNCLSDRNSSVSRRTHHGPGGGGNSSDASRYSSNTVGGGGSGSRTSTLYLPSLPGDREILLTPTVPRRSRLRARPKQRSADRASLESQQRSMEDDSPDFYMPGHGGADDATAMVSLDLTSSNENTADSGGSAAAAHHRLITAPSMPPSVTTTVVVPMLSYIDNLANNSTFSTMSTATASSNGSYQSDGGQDIPLTDLAPTESPLAPPHPAPAETTPPKLQHHPHHHIVDVSIETALTSSSNNDQDDTRL